MLQSLNNREREQYTEYLQNQIEKMNSFMLFQQKQNQKFRQMTQCISDQDQKIKHLTDKLILVELYQNENFKTCEKLQLSSQKYQELNDRMQRFQCFKETYSSNLIQSQRFKQPTNINEKMEIPSQQNSSSSTNKQYEFHVEENMRNLEELIFDEVDKINRNFNKKIKKVELNVEKNEQLLLKVVSSFQSVSPRIYENKKEKSKSKSKSKKSKSPTQNTANSENQSRLKGSDVIQEFEDQKTTTNRNITKKNVMKGCQSQLVTNDKICESNLSNQQRLKVQSKSVYEIERPRSPITSYMQQQSKHMEMIQNQNQRAMKHQSFYQIKSKKQRKNSRSKSKQSFSRDFSEKSTQRKTKKKKGAKQASFKKGLNSSKNIKKGVVMRENKIKNNISKELKIKNKSRSISADQSDRSSISRKNKHPHQQKINSKNTKQYKMCCQRNHWKQLLQKKEIPKFH